MSASVELELDPQFFNLLWRGLYARERELLAAIDRLGPDSDDGALLSNDLVYLRLCRKELQKRARDAGVGDSAFDTSDEFVELRDLLGPK